MIKRPVAGVAAGAELIVGTRECRAILGLDCLFERSNPGSYGFLHGVAAKLLDVMIKHTELKGNLLTLTIELASKPYVSASEKAKAAKANPPREAEAHLLASSGGFTRLPSGQRVSYNVMD